MTRPHLPFQLPSTFCGLPSNMSSLFGVIGAPVDSATTFRSGSRFGPQAIRQASLMLTDGEHPEFPCQLKDSVSDFGNMALPNGNTIEMLKAVEDWMDQCSASHMVTLGGDHSITLGILRSLYKRHGKMNLIHFDAHCDTWDNHFGEKYGHGTWLYNAIEEGLIDPAFTASIGIRSPSDKVSREYLVSKGGKTISVDQAMKWSEDVYQSREAHSGLDVGRNGKPTYLSFDIDCLDPAYAPGTGTPEIAGLTTRAVQKMLGYISYANLVGMDCVEVAPQYDHGDITSLAAATFVWQYLCMQVHKMENYES